ncbi:MAG: Ycf34 family protein [Cyanobacteria bacterium P01_D01_bin.73]
MCICVNCEYVDRCQTYHAVEEQHQQPHLTNDPDFEAVNPTVNVNIRNVDLTTVEMEWDVVGCESFYESVGKWSLLRPGELVPT